MTEGPMVTRLRQALQGADEGQALVAAQEWMAGSVLLESVRESLRLAAPRMAENLGPETSRKAVEAFEKMIAKVDERRLQMEQASTALITARDSLAAALRLRDQLDAQPLTDPGPFRPDPAMDKRAELDARAAHSVRAGAFQAQYAAREEQARLALQDMDTTYERSSETMRRIHGEPDRAGGPGAGASAGGSGTGGAGATVRHAGGHAGTTSHPAAAATGGPGTGAVDAPAAGGADPWPAGSGVPQGPSGTGDPTGAPLAPAPVSGSTAGAAGGVAGAVGGGLIGGLAGIGGAVRGGTVAALPTTAASGQQARAIGSTTRTGASGALGRPAAAAGSPTARTAASGGATGARGAGPRGASATGTPGSRPASAAGRGSSAGGRSGATRAPGAAGTAPAAASRGRRKDRTTGRESSEVGSDWIDDEDAAPGVID